MAGGQASKRAESCNGPYSAAGSITLWTLGAKVAMPCSLYGLYGIYSLIRPTGK